MPLAEAMQQVKSSDPAVPVAFQKPYLETEGFFRLAMTNNPAKRKKTKFINAVFGRWWVYLPFLQKINRKGVTGNIAFDSKGNIQEDLLSLYTDTSGKRSFVSVVQ